MENSLKSVENGLKSVENSLAVKILRGSFFLVLALIASYLPRVLGLPGAQPTADIAATLKFGAALTRLAAEDPAVHRLTMEVQHLLKPRSVYRDPKLIERVLAKMAEA